MAFKMAGWSAFTKKTDGKGDEFGKGSDHGANNDKAGPVTKSDSTDYNPQTKGAGTDYTPQTVKDTGQNPPPVDKK